MIMMIQQITQRLQEVNNLLATCKQDSITFEQALLLSLFYKDFNETNQIVTETAAMFHDDAEQLNEISFSLFRRLKDFCLWILLDCSPWILRAFLKRTSDRLNHATGKRKMLPPDCGASIRQ